MRCAHRRIAGKKKNNKEMGERMVETLLAISMS
jgi:hypothetical protein